MIGHKSQSLKANDALEPSRHCDFVNVTEVDLDCIVLPKSFCERLIGSGRHNDKMACEWAGSDQTKSPPRRRLKRLKSEEKSK